MYTLSFKEEEEDFFSSSSFLKKGKRWAVSVQINFVHKKARKRGCAQCLKITQKIAFDIASEASYVYILSRKKFIKNAKNGQFGMFWQTEATILTVLPDKPILIEQKSIEVPKLDI